MPSSAERLLGSFSRIALNSVMACSPLRILSARRRARNVLAGVGSSQIELGVRQRGIEFLGLLEIFDGYIELAAFIGVDALVEKVARLELVAARLPQRDNQCDGQTGHRYETCAASYSP